jgi:signal transduction histidine kinase
VYEELQWIQYLEAATVNGADFILRAPDLLIYPTDAPLSQFPNITDTRAARPKENRSVLFRQLSHVVPVNGTAYQIIIRKSQEQKAALVGNITRIMLLVFLGLFLATLLFNWLISRQLWQPFRVSLQKVRATELQKIEALRFEETSITEFNELNTALQSMAQKIHHDYVNMKEFTENAAHEMQTPLAVAQSKLELLLQDASLQEPQIEAISQASNSLNRLSKLVQALLLLAKIENNQYTAAETVSLTEHTRKYLSLFDEIIRDKQLTVVTDFSADFNVRLHPFLADSLISNLIGNSIKYNTAGGEIDIAITAQSYCIRNRSTLPPIATDQLFKRFAASGKTAEASTGLGLAIVKKIIDLHGLNIAYSFDNEHHSFCITKNS